MQYILKNKDIFPGLFRREENDFVLNKLYDDLINKNELSFDILQLLEHMDLQVGRLTEVSSNVRASPLRK